MLPSPKRQKAPVIANEGFAYLVARGGIDQGWGCLTLMTLQIINYPGWVTITWEDGIVNRLDYAIIRN